MIDLAAGLACAIIFAYVSILEKIASNKHHFMDISLSRVFYMLIMVLIIIIIFNPKVISSIELKKAFKDPTLIVIGSFTTIGMFIYYWLLGRSDLYLVSLIWPLITILTVIAGYLFINESLSKIQWFGVFLTLIGICLTLLKSKT